MKGKNLNPFSLTLVSQKISENAQEMQKITKHIPIRRTNF